MLPAWQVGFVQLHLCRKVGLTGVKWGGSACNPIEWILVQFEAMPAGLALLHLQLDPLAGVGSTCTPPSPQPGQFFMKNAAGHAPPNKGLSQALAQNLHCLQYPHYPFFQWFTFCKQAGRIFSTVLSVRMNDLQHRHC